METLGIISTAPLFSPLSEELVAVLRGLSVADWDRPTVCRKWAVRDIAAHLLDVDIRRLSFSRDLGELPNPDLPVSNYRDLVGFLNRLNAEWVSAARRISPRVLIDLLRVTGPWVAEHVANLDMMAPARFSVAWAGEDVSLNWFDVARDYTERWHHQQQIRDAVGLTALAGSYWLSPVLDTFMRSLPYHYRSASANVGEAIGFKIDGEAGGAWTLVRGADGWQLWRGPDEHVACRVVLDQDTAWRLFTKGIQGGEAKRRIQIEGAASLGEHLLSCLAVMA